MTTNLKTPVIGAGVALLALTFCAYEVETQVDDLPRPRRRGTDWSPWFQRHFPDPSSPLAPSR